MPILQCANLSAITGGDAGLPGRFVKYLIIKKSVDKVKEICYTLVTIKKGRIENGENLYPISPL